MSLLISSDAHREALFKVLKEVKVPEAVLEEALRHIANSIFIMDKIPFSPEEIDKQNG